MEGIINDEIKVKIHTYKKSNRAEKRTKIKSQTKV